MIYYIIPIVIGIQLLSQQFPEHANLFIDLLKNKIELFTRKIQPKLITFIYNIIYIYSRAQLLAINIKRQSAPHVHFICSNINTFLVNHKIISNHDTNKKPMVVELYNNGLNIHKEYLHDRGTLIDLMDTNSSPNINEYNNFNLLVLTDNSVDKLLYQTVPTDISYDYSKIKFFSMELYYNNNVFPIELSNDKQNYYIVNNVINEQFYRYYLNNMLGVFTPIDFPYSVQIIDHNVELKTLSPSEAIIIKENDYEIVTIENEIDDDDNDVDGDLEQDQESDKDSDKEQEPEPEPDKDQRNSIHSDNSDDYITLESPNKYY